MRSLLKIESSLTISLAALFVPNQIADNAVINGTAGVMFSKMRQISIAIIGACRSITIELTLSLVLILK